MGWLNGIKFAVSTKSVEIIVFFLFSSDPQSLTLMVAFYKVIIQVSSSKKVDDLRVTVK